MNITLDDINLYIPKEVTDKLPRKKFQPGEIILESGDRRVLFILDGEGHLIRYQGSKKIKLHFTFRKNNIVGFNMLLSPKVNNWEFTPLTHGEVMILPYDIVEKYIIDVPGAFKFFIEKTIHIVENSINGFYILAHGGAKPYLAFLFIGKAEEGRFTYERFEDFSEVLGVSKSMLHRITKSLVDDNLIKREKNSIVILDEDGLKELYEEYLYF